MLRAEMGWSPVWPLSECEPDALLGLIKIKPNNASGSHSLSGQTGDHPRSARNIEERLARLRPYAVNEIGRPNSRYRGDEIALV